MARPRTDIALTGFAGLARPAPGQAVARALREGWPGALHITAFCESPLATGAWRPGLVDRIRVLPSPCKGNDPWLRTIADTHEHNAIAALIPGTRADALAVARLADRLSRLGIATLLPRPDGLEAIQPHRLTRMLATNGIAGPPSFVADTSLDVPWLANQLGYPLFVDNGIDARLVTSAVAARAAVDSLRAAEASNAPVVLKRHVLGETFGVALVADVNGACAGHVVRRAMALDSAGRTVTGAVVDDREVSRFAREVLERLEWRGPLTLTIVRPARSSDLLLCDAKPWLPSWSMLCHWAGMNLAVALVDLMLRGGERPRARQRARIGTMSIQGIEEAAIPLDRLTMLQRGKSAPGIKIANGSGGRSAAANPADDRHHGLRVAVTGLSTCDVVNPGLGVARSLRTASGIGRIIGLSYGSLESGAFQPELFDAAFQISPADTRETLLERLQTIHEEDPFDVLVPCLDGELSHFIDLASPLRRMGVRTLLPRRESLKRRSKHALFGGKTKADWAGFVIPESRIARSEADVLKAVRVLGIPAVVKGVTSHCIPVDSAQEARFAWSWLAPSKPKAVIVQPRIEGPIYAVSAVCDRDHRVISCLTVKKLAICERGSTWGATHVREPALEKAFASFLHEISWVGPAEGEFIRDEMTDRFNLIEINPRFTAWIYFTVATGSNQPYLAVRAAMDERVNPPSDQAPVAFGRNTIEIHLRPAHIAALATRKEVRHG